MKLDRTQLHQATITNHAHDGRGIAVIDGKTTFIRNAIAGEVVEFQYSKKHRRFDEGQAVHILEAAKTRVTPKCQYTHICGGCQLQHMHSEAQIALKQQTLAEQFQHFGNIQPEQWQPPMTGPVWGYRRKARLSVKHVPGKGKVLVGFREINGRFVADMDYCDILHPRVAALITPLSQLIAQLTCPDHIPQVEIAVAEPQPALIVRHLVDFSTADYEAWITFAKTHEIALYLQPSGLNSVHKLWPKDNNDLLNYQHTDHQITLQFHPNDFTQINFSINQQLVNLTIELLNLNTHDKVLDLFCGLGNFSLPIARYCQHVTAIEGNANMVTRGQHNAKLNGLNNITFLATDLSQDIQDEVWAQQHYDKILIDPPRCGAEYLISQIRHFSPQKIVYISCDPATLARDAGILKEQGYTLKLAGVMDMFPHTKHVESIAVFTPS